MESAGLVPGRKGTQTKDSESATDLLCSICALENRKTDAEKYCLQCQDYFCQKCVTIHDKLAILSGHVIIGRSDFGDLECRLKLPSIPTERCLKHTTKLMDMYCDTHDKVGCGTCMVLEHGKPCNVLYIPDNLTTLHSQKDVRLATGRLDATIDALKNALIADKQDKSHWAELKSKTLSSITGFKDEIVEHLNKLERETIEALNAWCREADDSAEKQTKRLSQQLAAAEDIRKKLSMADDNEAQEYVCCKEAFLIADKQEEINSALCEVEEIKFHQNATMLESVFKESSLGTFSNALKRRVYKIKKKDIVRVWSRDKSIACNISGCCTIGDNTVLYTDLDNFMLKRLAPYSSHVRLKDQLLLADRPWAVCTVGLQEVAVTLPYINQVQFVTVDSTMKLKRVMMVRCKCCAIAYVNGELFISDDATVYVYTIAGALTRQFTWEKTGDKLFSDIRNITPKSDGLALYVADKKKGLIAVNTDNGNVIFKYKDEKLKDICDVCTDGHGNIFVCGWTSHNIMQISENGEMVGETVEKAESFPYPQAICLSRSCSRLYLFRWGNEGMLFDLKY